LIPKFVREYAASAYELRNRDTEAVLGPGGIAPTAPLVNLCRMWGRKREPAEPPKPPEARSQRLKDALHKARVESAERTGIVVDLHDAEVARLELLHEALAPLFDEIPADVELFDLGISRGETPRLWIDAVAHITMDRDKRVYRFAQDIRYGRKVLAETVHIPEMVQAVTRYLAQRLVERERALADIGMPQIGRWRHIGSDRHRWRLRAIAAFLLGLIAGIAVLIVAALLFGPR
jgi:hypothetical protein